MMPFIASVLGYFASGYGVGYLWAKWGGVVFEERQSPTRYYIRETNYFVGEKTFFPWFVDEPWWTLKNVFWLSFLLPPVVILGFGIKYLALGIGSTRHGARSLYGSFVKLTYKEPAPEVIAPAKTPELIAAEKEVDALLGEVQ